MIEQSSISQNSARNAILATIFSVASFVLFMVFVFAMIYGIFAAPLVILLSVTILALSMLFRLLSAKANVSFDYLVGNGEFVIGKVINNKKRKDIFVLSPENILRVTVITEYTGERKDKKIVYCLANDLPPEGKRFVLLETTDKLIFMEADETLINILKNKNFFN